MRRSPTISASTLPRLRTDIALLTRIEGSECAILALRGPGTLPVSPGDRVAVRDTFCGQIIETDQPLAIEHTGAGPCEWVHERILLFLVAVKRELVTWDWHRDTSFLWRKHNRQRRRT